MDKQEIMKGIKELGLFDFIARKGNDLTKGQLIDIIKEMDYAAYSKVDGAGYKEIEAQLLEALEERLA